MKNNLASRHLTMTDILYEKQFGFQERHSTEHAIIQLNDQIGSSFERSHFTLGIFNELSKAFDTANHQILICKLRNYGVNGSHLRWYESNLKNCKQFLAFSDNNKTRADIICGLQQCSILGPVGARHLQGI